MVIKGAKTIAEYAIRSWLLQQNFAMEYFDLAMDGNKGVLKDQSGDELILVYDAEKRAVYVSED